MENFFIFINDLFEKEDIEGAMYSVEDSVLNSGGMEDISYRDFKEEVLCRLIERNFEFNIGKFPDNDDRESIKKYAEETAKKWNTIEKVSHEILEGGILCERDAIQEAINKY